jgi:putative ABC transport system permease protein
VQTTPIVLAVVLAFLAFLVLAYLLITSLRSRRHDFAIYKTLGFTRRQVSSTVACQATTVTALALLIGIPVGIVAGRLAWVAFTTSLGIPPDATVPGAPLAIAALVALLVANAIAAVPGRAVGREEPASLLRTD